MRLALMTQSCDNQTGIGRIVVSLAKEFAAHGHEVNLVAQTFEANNAGWKNHCVPFATRFNSLNRLAFRYTAHSILKPLLCDVVNSFMIGRGASVVTAQSCHKAGMAIRKQHAKDSIWRRNYGLFDRVTLADEKFLCSSSATKRIIAVSALVKGQIMAYYDVEPNRIEVVPNGVDINYFLQLRSSVDRVALRSQHDISSDDFVLLFVGNEFDRKGLQYIIQSMAQLRRKHVRLLVVGSDDPIPYRTLASKLNVDDRIIFAGGVKGPENLFIVADVLVLPTLYEPFGLVIIEAMAAGLPVIASKATGALERFSHGTNGLFLDDPTSIDELTYAIQEMADDEALRRKIVRANDTAVREYSWERIAAQTLNVYREAIDA